MQNYYNNKYNVKPPRNNQYNANTNVNLENSTDDYSSLISENLTDKSNVINNNKNIN